MAYNTKSLLRDLEGKIVPQGFDVAADNYRALTGQNLGNNRFGLDGIQWGKTETGLFVPMAVTDEGHVKVQQVGNMVELANISNVTVTAGSNVVLLQTVKRLDYNELRYCLRWANELDFEMEILFRDSGDGFNLSSVKDTQQNKSQHKGKFVELTSHYRMVLWNRASTDRVLMACQVLGVR